MSEINYVCSLGSLCHSSQILKKNGYKKCSYPFDWIFSNCDNIIHCINDDFKIFLDKSYYVSIYNKKCAHKLYHNEMFNHHNPLIHVDDYNYFVRCVDRFRNLLKKEEHKLFLMISVNQKENLSDSFMNKIVDFNNKFSKHTQNYTLLVIYHVPDKEQHNHISTHIDNIHFIELHTFSKSNGVNFCNKQDDNYLDNVINSIYKFNIMD